MMEVSNDIINFTRLNIQGIYSAARCFVQPWKSQQQLERVTFENKMFEKIENSTFFQNAIPWLGAPSPMYSMGTNVESGNSSNHAQRRIESSA
jgi:hypothetical protein